jgi:hypothetical protein
LKGREGGEARFFLAIASVNLFLVFAGFAPSFYLRDAALAPLPPLFLAHGAVLTLWYLIALAQPALIAGGRYGAHRILGIAGAVLAVFVFATGLMAGADAMARGVGVGGADAQTFFYLSVSDAVLFAALVAAGVAFHAAPAAHKRLMTIASISILFPALGRLAVALGLDGAFAVAPYTVLLASIALHDLMSHKRFHLATIAGGGAAFAKIVSYLPVGGGELWRRIVETTGLPVGP